MSFSDRSTGKPADDGIPASVSSIPLSDLDAEGQASIGSLVKNVTSQVSTLVRAEVELAKAEVTGEIKRGLQGSVFFLLALTVLFFSTFFLFFFCAELIDVWLPRWSAFLIVFGFMVLVALILALLGYLRVRKIRAPQKTIGSVKEIPSVLHSADKSHAGLPGTAAGNTPVAAERTTGSGRHAR